MSRVVGKVYSGDGGQIAYAGLLYSDVTLIGAALRSLIKAFKDRFPLHPF